MKTSEKRIEELAEFLNIDRADIVPDDYTDNQFNTLDGDYLVLTDEEADNATAEYIKYSIWAFNPEFIISECGLCNNLSYPESCDLINSLRAIQEKICDSSNHLLTALVKGTCGLDTFIADAINTDGRGHFISDWDGKEYASKNFYIYRIN